MHVQCTQRMGTRGPYYSMDNRDRASMMVRLHAAESIITPMRRAMFYVMNLVMVKCSHLGRDQNHHVLPVLRRADDLVS